MENETEQLFDKERIKALGERIEELEAELEAEKRRYCRLLTNMQTRITNAYACVRRGQGLNAINI